MSSRIETDTATSGTQAPTTSTRPTATPTRAIPSTAIPSPSDPLTWSREPPLSTTLPTPSTMATPTEPPARSGTPTAAIAGGVLGGLLLIIAGLGLVLWYIKRIRQRNALAQGDAQESTMPPPPPYEQTNSEQHELQTQSLSKDPVPARNSQSVTEEGGKDSSTVVVRESFQWPWKKGGV